MNPKLEEIVQRFKNLDRANLREFAVVIQPISHTGFDVSNILNDLCDFFNDMDNEDGDFRLAKARHYRYVCRNCGKTTRSIRPNKLKCPACGKWKLERIEGEG